jgi:putative ubiquitin-RnfH superfamily antitoxin RatB of RatAB toxin-antitoxin module
MEVREPHIQVEVVYALAHKRVIRQLSVPPGTTAEQAVVFSEITHLFPEINLSRNKLGIYGKLVKPATLLYDRDRVEIYRPLMVDPKESRRRRAKKSAGHPAAAKQAEVSGDQHD